jgi:hypothetical protein
MRSGRFPLCPYSLETEDPNSGEAATESYASMPAAVARADCLLRAGYRVGIWSSSSLEQEARSPASANDDARDALFESPEI